MNKNNLFEELNIKKSENVSYTALDIDIRNIKHRVNAKIASADTERTLNIMKSKKKLSLIAAAAVLIFGITAFAASGIVKTWSSVSSSMPDYKSVPTQEQVMKDVGYEVILIDSFENGYAFKEGSVVKNKLSDEKNNVIEKFKSVDFRYEKDGDTVYFSQKKFNAETEKQGTVIEIENGIDINYFSYANKFVPADYKLTEEDKKAEENGEFVFSYGDTSDIEIIEVQSIIWENDGIEYCLMQMDGKLTADELAGMAKEIINKDNP